MFDMDSETPDMMKLAPAHDHTLPVWVRGNAYFAGAKAYHKETDHLVDNEHEIKVDVVMKDGKPVLETNVYDFLGDYATAMVDSDILGCAFEPEERFENPDGTAIVFDRDYFDDHRGVKVIPGPFASAQGAKKALW